MGNFIGDAGNNVLTGTDDFDVLDGLAGNDTLKGGKGNDFYVLQFVDSADTVIVEAANGGIDSVRVEDASFSLADLAHVEHLQIAGNGFSATGNDLSNRLIGNAGVNLLIGGKGNDTLDGGGGGDTLGGGAGNDVYFVDSAADQVLESIGDGKDAVHASVTYTLTDNQEIEALVLTADNISGFGNDLNNLLTGSSGDNLLSGLGGNDTLNGGDGGDVLIGGAGNDAMAGGKGDDRYGVESAGDKISEGVNAGRDEVISSLASYTLGANLEDLTLADAALNGTGNTLGNKITGNAGLNTLDGGGGNDLLDGAGGNDILIGGLGNDILVGGAGDDDLFGGAGDDVLDGGTSSDQLTGGAGKDRFVFSTGQLETIGIDSITDFARGADTIDLRSLLADFEIEGEDAFAEGHILLDVINGDTRIRFSAAGDGQDAVTLALAHNVALTQSDFVLEF